MHLYDAKAFPAPTMPAATATSVLATSTAVSSLTSVLSTLLFAHTSFAVLFSMPATSFIVTNMPTPMVPSAPINNVSVPISPNYK
ncbi:hypothetical protein CVT25_004908 [Psilocybe cyanescens]|uniref:Uncharacterized protein n=1 Tax=Psilocybe cyanescens TaxID=93625 RepID=A0A409XRT1_PSICY|nr:hypothetical protein CVT25_004908 [Psilocybe cyanescens]